MLQNSQKNTCVGVSFLVKVQDEGLQLYQKKLLAQVFSSEFCEFLKSTNFVLWNSDCLL